MTWKDNRLNWTIKLFKKPKSHAYCVCVTKTLIVLLSNLIPKLPQIIDLFVGKMKFHGNFTTGNSFQKIAPIKFYRNIIKFSPCMHSQLSRAGSDFPLWKLQLLSFSLIMFSLWHSAIMQTYIYIGMCMYICMCIFFQSSGSSNTTICRDRGHELGQNFFVASMNRIQFHGLLYTVFLLLILILYARNLARFRKVIIAEYIRT